MLQFLNKRVLTEDMNYGYNCQFHFEDKFLNRNKDRVRLINAKKKKHLLPTLFPEGINRRSISTAKFKNV